MKPSLKSRSKLKIKRTTPGGKHKIIAKERKSKYHSCCKCKKRNYNKNVSRIYKGTICAECLIKELKKKVRGG